MRTIPDPGFAGDDGGVDPGVAAALAAYDAPAGRRALRAPRGARPCSRTSRLLVPVVALLGEVERVDGERSGSAREDQRHGRRTDDGPGRPHRAAGVHQHREPGPLGTVLRRRRGPAGPGAGSPGGQAALQDQASALLVDVAGPVMFVVEGEDLRVAGRRPPTASGSDGAGPGCSPRLVGWRLDFPSGSQPCTLVPDRSCPAGQDDPTSGGLLPPASTELHQVVGSGHEQGDVAVAPV